MPGLLLNVVDVAPLAVAVMAASFLLTYVTHRVWRALRRNVGPKRKETRAKPDLRAASSARPGPKLVAASAEADRPASVTWDDVPAPRAPVAAARSASSSASVGALAASLAPPVHERALPAGFPGAPRGVSATEWEALVRDIVREEGILAENRSRLSRRRSLLSLLSNVRDRELLYERGTKIGVAIHATTYGSLGQKLADNHVCAEARFRKGVGETLIARLVGTVMAREAPVIGTPVCFIEAGLLAGALGNLEGGVFTAREVKCCVAGDPFCEFVAERVADVEPTPSLYDAPKGVT